MHVGVTGIGIVADAEKTFESFDGSAFLFIFRRQRAAKKSGSGSESPVVRAAI